MSTIVEPLREEVDIYILEAEDLLHSAQVVEEVHVQRQQRVEKLAPVAEIQLYSLKTIQNFDDLTVMQWTETTTNRKPSYGHVGGTNFSTVRRLQYTLRQSLWQVEFKESESGRF